MGFLDEYNKALDEIFSSKAASTGGSSGSKKSFGGSAPSYKGIGHESFYSGSTAKTFEAPLYKVYKRNGLTTRNAVSEKLTVKNSSRKKKDEEKKWYQKGLFEDGYDFGDVTKTILGIDDKSTRKTFTDSVPEISLEELNQKRLSEKDVGKQLEYTQQYNDKMLAHYSDVFANTEMDGKNHSVLEEMNILADMDSGKEKEERKKAVLAKMEELGVDSTFYAHFAGDGSFDWDTFGKWAKSSVLAGLNSFNKGILDTADVLVGGILRGAGWENNPISKGADHYGDLYNANAYNKALYAEKLGGGAWNFAGDAVEGTLGAVPNAILAMMTAGTSMAGTASTIGANLSTQAAYQTGNILTKAGLTTEAMLKNPQYWLSFARTLGFDYQEAKGKGASDALAAFGSVLSSAINAGIEIGPDGASGIQGLPSDLKNGDGNKILDWVESSLEEGGEEALQKFVNEIVGKFVYKSDDEILNPVEYGKDAALGTISGMFLGGGQVVANEVNNQVNKSLANRLTQTEQAVVDKVAADRIAEAEKDGKKLSNSAKKKITEAVVADMDKGFLSIDDIESALGGKTYEDYKRISEWEDGLQKEFDELHAMKRGEMTGEQIDREADLKHQIRNVKATSSRDALKTKLSDDVFSLANGSRLAESYKERVRTGQKFEADVSKYDAKQQAVVQKAIDSGILNNSNRTHDFVDFVSKISADSGVLFDFSNTAKIREAGFAVEGKTVDGYISKDGITVNIDSPKSRQFVVGHEITHALEGTEHYDAMRKSIIDYAKTKGDYEARMESIQSRYKEGTDFEAELTADLVGEYIFSDTDFINHLFTQNRNVFQKIYDEIKYLCKVATAGSKEARELEKVKRAFEKTYREGGKTQSDTKLHVSENFSNEIDKVLNNEMDNSSQVKARDFTPEILVNNGVSDLPMLITQNHVRTTIYSESEAKALGLPTGKNNNYHGLGKELLMQSIDNMDNPSAIYKKDNEHYIIVTEMQNTDGETIIIPVKIDGKGTYNDVYIDENQIQSAYGKKNLQNYLDRNNFELIYEKSTALNEGVQYSNIGDALSSNNIPDSGDNVKHSLSDSDGKQLTKEQQEYFKDSKMRDENGSLKVMYHGTPNGEFTIFKDGTYFTDSKEYADLYQNPNASMLRSGKNASNPKTYEVYLNIKKPFDINDADAREIYINDYIKGGNALGINPYLSDAEYAKINSIDFTEGEDLRDFLIENEYDYDGLVLDEGATGGYGYEVKSRGKSYVVFSPEQVKNVANLNPTTDSDIRYSLSDKYYLDAVNRGDMEAAQQMVNAAAKAAGYSDDLSWKMQHTAPNSKYDISLVNLKDSGLVPSDYWDHPEWYTYGAEERESFHKVKNAITRQERYAAIGKERDARLWVYRAVDKTVNAREDFFRNGDWVTPSHDYAVNEGQMNPKGYRIIKASVPIKDLYWDGNSIAELGYDDGNSYAYADTKNNRKLLDPVTYDDAGNVIPLSKRFKKRIDDTRYSVSNVGEQHTPDSLSALRLDAPVAEESSVTETSASEPVSISDMFPDAAVAGTVDNELLVLKGERASLQAELMQRYNNHEYNDKTEQLAQEWTKLNNRIASMEQSAKAESAPKEESKPKAEVKPKTTKERAQEHFRHSAVDQLYNSDIPSDTEQFKAIERATEVAQDFISNGTDKVKPIPKIFGLISDNGALDDFELYLRHKLNEDRMTLDVRHGKSNLPVFGPEVTALKSRQEVSRLLQEHPEFKSAANDVYAYNDYILDMLVRGGKVTRESAEYFKILYPHYVPISRARHGSNQAYSDLLNFFQNQKAVDLTDAEGLDKFLGEVDESSDVHKITSYGYDFNPLIDTMVNRAFTAHWSVAMKEVNNAFSAPMAESSNTDSQSTPQPEKVIFNVESAVDSTQELDYDPISFMERNRVGVKTVFDEYILDNGYVFEKLDRKEGGRSNQAYWHAIRNAHSSAQYFLGKGADGVKPAVDILKSVKDSGLANEFYSYLGHLRNIDGMSLQSRYGVANNRNFMGNSATFAKSTQAVKNLEERYPQLKTMAEDMYKNVDYVLSQYVEHGMLTKGDIDLLKELYPHYVPMRFDTNGNVDGMMETLAQFTNHAFNSWAMNDFAKNLKNTLHTEIANEPMNIDTFINSLDNGDDFYSFGDDGEYKTVTCYENGELRTFDITNEMYMAMSDSANWLSWKIPVLHQVNEGFRKFCTEWNIFFAMKNGVKDPQDIMWNSQHSMETYCQLINAGKAVWSEDSKYRKYYDEYLANGGESIEYFDTKHNEFNSKTDLSNIIKTVTGLKVVEGINNRIETTPRLAEYIASREAGKSVQEAMLDSARVTTNFAAGGKFAKFLNRNGCTFLNASIQGALQHHRNIVEAAADPDGRVHFDTRVAKMNALKGELSLIARGLAAGLTTIVLNGIRWDDDEDYEVLPDYVKEGYYLVGKFGDGQFVRIPKGRTNATIEEAVRQVALHSWGDDNADWNELWDMVIENIAPNNPFSDNIFAPILEVKKGETWYGEEMIPYRLQDLPTTEQFDEKTDTWSIKLSEWLYDTDIGKQLDLSPKEINYLINSYTGVLGDLILPLNTPKAESPYDNPLAQAIVAPIRDIFTTDSVWNNQITGDFFDTMEFFETRATSENATERDKLINQFFISNNVEMSDLWKEIRDLQTSDMPDSEKYEKSREMRDEINRMMEEAMEVYNDGDINVDVSGVYAEVGDRRYNYGLDKDTNEYRWFEIKPKNADGTDNWFYQQEQLAKEKFGVSYKKFWNNFQGYSDALYVANNWDEPYYETVKHAIGVEKFAEFASDLAGIKADKDTNGESISGSRKRKVKDYIYSLDIDEAQKHILFKAQYPYTNKNNYQIIDYLNERDNISYKEMKSILEELGFKVDDKGNISW